MKCPLKFIGKNDATAGHRNRIEACKLNPTSAWNVRLDEIINF